jgi:hypothetical protein
MHRLYPMGECGFHVELRIQQPGRRVSDAWHEAAGEGRAFPKTLTFGPLLAAAGLGHGKNGGQQTFPKTLTYDAVWLTSGGLIEAVPVLYSRRTHSVRNPVSTHLLS